MSITSKITLSKETKVNCGQVTKFQLPVYVLYPKHHYLYSVTILLQNITNITIITKLHTLQDVFVFANTVHYVNNKKVLFVLISTIRRKYA